MDIVMPNMGFDAQEARIVEWLKNPGDLVRRGDVIAVIESDKANVELESLGDGVLLEQLFPPDTLVKVGAIIARVGSPNEQAIAPSSPTPTLPMMVEVSPVARRIAEEHGLDLAAVTGSGPSGKIMRQDVEKLIQSASVPQPSNGKKGIMALPKVRQTARQLGVSLADVTPTGRHGEITLADIQQRISTPAREKSGVREIALSRMRQTIGERLHRSMQEAPHFYVSGEFDLEAALTRLKTISGVRVNDLLQYLVVQTLLRVPELNATFENGHLYYHETVNLAIAVSLEDGLITPVLADAQQLSLQGIAQASRALVERARSNHLHPSDLQSGTFTISNLGVVKQVDQFTAVINPPQVGILAVGTVKPRPVVINGGLHVRNTVYLTLSGDHRVVDGMTLGKFMATFQEELERFS
ncbi:MAG: 2-oxo acid dehydrogenase subunit E2 [Chloroflexi bacterium]|nr:2-oxo acid dehydrogenase subunit E2 [Chloroflexota bacterium]